MKTFLFSKIISINIYERKRLISFENVINAYN